MADIEHLDSSPKDLAAEERKAAAARMRAEIEADRASRPVKEEKPRDLYAGAKPRADAPPSPAPEKSSVEKQIDELQTRPFQYLRAQHTDHQNNGS